MCLMQGAFSHSLLYSQALFSFMAQKQLSQQNNVTAHLVKLLICKVQHSAHPFSNIVHSRAHQSVAVINISCLKQNSVIQGIREDENVGRWLVHNAQFSSTDS